MKEDRSVLWDSAGLWPSRLALQIYWLLLPWPLLAADTNTAPDGIPPLRPPRGEIPPSYWEQHAAATVLLAMVLLLVIAGAIWLLTRPKPPVVVPPSVVARRSLEPLSARPEDGALLSQASQILRHYVADAFGLSAGELTTADLYQLLDGQAAVGPELTAALGEFFRRCDQRKFAPGAALPPLGAVSEALRLIDRCEARLAQWRQSTASAPTPINPVQPERARAVRGANK